MISFTSSNDVFVYTQRGLIPVKDLVPFDFIHKYPSGKMIPVRGIKKTETTDLWKIKYSDGREQVINITSNIFTGSHVIPLIEALQSNGTFFDIVQTVPLDFSMHTNAGTLYPDPYITGALLMHGDYDDPYLNLPLDRDSANREFANRYNLDFAKKLGDNRVYFRWDGTLSTRCITWKEFFKRKKMYVLTKKLTDPLIPDEYKYGSINNRWQFVRGAFDLGYSKREFPDNIGMSCTATYRLEELQKILWSLGVCSTIDKNPLGTNKRNFKLEILGAYDQYPGFFDDINHIHNTIENDMRILWKPKPFQMKVVDAERVGRGYTYEIVLDRPGMLFFEENFLPRCSV